ncbi:carbamoyltransferase C-terminal domain-containing protein [Kitasatospora sp. NPDC101447]|uniref:carbamoyltransferase C-terminal domain-containing protein n=1 Tax=Kitasatospora sp. NPDC101447 TaxID=3364102 RepID=UPI0037FFC773
MSRSAPPGACARPRPPPPRSTRTSAARCATRTAPRRPRTAWSARSCRSSRSRACCWTGRWARSPRGGRRSARALCHRSILAVPRDAGVADRVNRIKDRERWRPFAGVTRAAHGPRFWGDVGHLSRYMLGAAPVTPEGRATAAGVVHVDGTTRPQLLAGDEAPVVGALLDELDRQGAPPVLLNTSFNGKGEPIVDSADDALRAFRAMDLDFLILEDSVYRKPYRR